MPAAEHRAGDAEVLRLRFEEALEHYRDEEDLRRLCALGVTFGRYRIVTTLRRFLSDEEYRRFLQERALPQVPIGGDKASGFSVDEGMLAEIAAHLEEPIRPLLAATVRKMIADGSRHIAKLYVLARLAEDPVLVRQLQPGFDARAAEPRAALAGDVPRRWPVAILQAGDDDDYNPKSASLFIGDRLVIKEQLRLHLDPSTSGGYSEERELLAELRHRRIVRLLEHATVGRHELMLLERAAGQTLDGSALSRPDARRVTAQLAELLAWLHARGILYLDVKPQNLVFDGDHLTVVDFGMARRGTRVCSMLSTLEYVPPEMARGFVSTRASDVFQLGLVAYQLLVGRHPFSNGAGVDVALANLWDEPDLAAPELGEQRALIGRMLARLPEDRPTAADVHTALRAAWSTFPRIIATLGTTTDDPTVLADMVAAGMGMARLNSAYATLDELRARIALANAASVPVMLDLKGPQLRIECTTTKVDPQGQTVTVPCRYPIAKGEVIRIGFGVGPVRFNHVFALDVGDLVTFDNGTIRTRVVDPAARGFASDPEGVLLEVEDAGAGKLQPRMGANVPGKQLAVARLSLRDHEVIALGVELDVAWYALSFVREPADVLHLHEKLLQAGAPAAALILKIEEPSGIAQLEAIVAAAQTTGRELAVMIARGDLFVELPWSQLPTIQADLLRRCRALAVPAIVATGLLLSMQHSPVPARSEVCDVAAAAAADSWMLSDETSNSKYPVGAVRALAEHRGSRKPS